MAADCQNSKNGLRSGSEGKWRANSAEFRQPAPAQERKSWPWRQGNRKQPGKSGEIHRPAGWPGEWSAGTSVRKLVPPAGHFGSPSRRPVASTPARSAWAKLPGRSCRALQSHGGYRPDRELAEPTVARRLREGQNTGLRVFAVVSPGIRLNLRYADCRRLPVWPAVSGS